MPKHYMQLSQSSKAHGAVVKVMRRCSTFLCDEQKWTHEKVATAVKDEDLLPADDHIYVSRTFDNNDCDPVAKSPP